MVEAKGVQKVEAVLFASGKAMEEDHIKELTELKPKETKTALEALQEKYKGADGALFVWNEGTKWKINVKEEFISLVKTLAAETELSRPVLETLAITAYRSPVLQSEIINTRGDGAYAHLAELTEKGFVTKEKSGRSYKLKITDKFYHYFDVTGDKDIRDAFSQAKQPDVEKHAEKARKKLGTLQVVEALSDKEVDKLHKETQLEIYSIDQQRESDKKSFLNGFEKQLDESRKRIEEAEGDIIKQKAASDAEKATETESETSDAEQKEESSEEPSPKKDYESMAPQEFAKEMEEQVDEMIKKEEKD